MADPQRAQLRCAIVLRAAEGTCQVLSAGVPATVRYAAMFPSPRAERVLPGHLVAIASTATGDAIVWRWYDAVVLGDADDGVRLWEPAHGEVIARRRHAQRLLAPGTRAYLSAGLPGADWWVTGPTVAHGQDADVELTEVERFYTEHDLWDAV